MPQPSRPIRRIAITFLIALLSVMLIAAGCADRLILPPVPPAASGDGSQRVMIARGDGSALESYRARSPGARTTEPDVFVLRFSGDANGAAQWTADRWRDRAVEAWVVNYPGYGASSGPRTLREMSRAALAAHDEMRRVAGDRPIVLEGFSLGTVPALHVAANRPDVAGVIVQNPAPLRPLVLRHHGWWNLWLLAAPVALSLPREVDSIANARRSGPRAVFLIADRDRVIPPVLQREIYDAYRGPKRLIVQTGADHVAPLDEPTAAELHAATDWLVGGAR